VVLRRRLLGPSRFPGPRPPRLLTALIALASFASGCRHFWPDLVNEAPHAPLFSSTLSVDPALCSLASVGADTTLLVSPAEPIHDAGSLAEVCKDAKNTAARSRHEHGRTGRLVKVETSLGDVHGYFYGVPGATGVLVAFAGLAMPSGGWINERFAERASARQLATFAIVRDESVRPISFDPVREAKRAIEVAKQIRTTCDVAAPAEIRFVGISMGGLESLLANREALLQGLDSRVAALDPVLDFTAVTDNLDGYWHGVSTHSMQLYFRRILRARYAEPESTSFAAIMERVGKNKTALTNPKTDVPSAWLCKAKRNKFAVFLSSTDPVLGDDQREFAKACQYPVHQLVEPGHTPLACRLELFDEMLDELRPRKAAIARTAQPGPR
jgi:hypothetical protein